MMTLKSAIILSKRQTLITHQTSNMNSMETAMPGESTPLTGQRVALNSFVIWAYTTTPMKLWTGRLLKCSTRDKLEIAHGAARTASQPPLPLSPIPKTQLPIAWPWPTSRPPPTLDPHQVYSNPIG